MAPWIERHDLSFSRPRGAVWNVERRLCVGEVGAVVGIDLALYPTRQVIVYIEHMRNRLEIRTIADARLL
jgi:hypothetical protein